MRPPDDLSSLKRMPVLMGAAGALLVPSMWVFALDRIAYVAVAPITGLVFLASGLYLKYRARYTPREALWGAVLALFFFGSLLVGATTGLAWRAHRPDLQPLAMALAALMFMGSMAIGVIAERRRLRIIDRASGLPAALMPMLDLTQWRVLPLAAPPPPRTSTVALLTAVALNVPLVLQIGGWNAIDAVWLIMPAMASTVSVVLASGFGPALARALVLIQIEQRTGRPLVTSRLEELRTIRRGFWLYRWLGRVDEERVS